MQFYLPESTREINKQMYRIVQYIDYTLASGPKCKVAE